MFSPRTDRFQLSFVRLGVILGTFALCAAVVVSLPALAKSEASGAREETTGAADSSQAPSSASVERGRYIAHDVAMCVQCHSSRNGRGELVGDRLFLGGPIPMKSPYSSTPRWAFTAPNLRNVPGFTEAEFLEFLMTGIRPNGTEARSPMPPFRMNRGDAKAVYDYLMSF